ncbi:uncharacterized protein LOC144451649 [Glandiceps talaboti]
MYQYHTLALRSLLVFYVFICQHDSLSTATCDEWTEWMDEENGALIPVNTDEFEQLTTLRNLYTFCDSPIDIECRRGQEPYDLWYQTGQSLYCDLGPGIDGLVCPYIDNSPSYACYNYEIRVLCPTPCPTTTLPTTLEERTTENISHFSTTVGSTETTTGQNSQLEENILIVIIILGAILFPLILIGVALSIACCFKKCMAKRIHASDSQTIVVNNNTNSVHLTIPDQYNNNSYSRK